MLAGATVAGLAWLTPAAGAGEPSPVAIALEYSAAATCPDADVFAATVTERLGYDVFSADAPSRVLVGVTSNGASFTGRMEWRDPQGNWAGDRAFPDHRGDCEDLVRAMAFTLALQLLLTDVQSASPAADTESAAPESTATAPAPHPPPPAEETRVPAPPNPIRPAPRPLHHTRSRPVPFLGAGSLVGFGLAARALPFVHVAGGTHWPRGTLSLAAEASLPATVRRADGAGFSQRQVLASLAGCGTRPPWSVCGVVKAGRVSVTGRDIDMPATAHGPLFAAGLRAAATLRLSRHVHLSPSAEALVLPILWSVTLDDTPAWTSPRFVETLGVDLEYRFRHPARTPSSYPDKQ